jgi:hypothetical protein
MPKLAYNLDTRIAKTLEICKTKRVVGKTLQNYLVDALDRYIIPFQDKTPLVNCIKLYHLSEGCEQRYKSIIEAHKLDRISETVKLLLKKAIYLEYSYREKIEIINP